MNKRKLRSVYRKYVFSYTFEVVKPLKAPIDRESLLRHSLGKKLTSALENTVNQSSFGAAR